MKHGLEIIFENPGSLRVPSVANPWFRSHAAPGFSRLSRFTPPQETRRWRRGWPARPRRRSRPRGVLPKSGANVRVAVSWIPPCMLPYFSVCTAKYRAVGRGLQQPLFFPWRVRWACADGIWGTGARCTDPLAHVNDVGTPEHSSRTGPSTTRSCRRIITGAALAAGRVV